MEVLCLNGVMANPKRKVQSNFFLPEELKRLVDEVASGLGNKRQWMLYTAALVAFLELPQAERDRRVQEINAGDLRGDFDKLADKLRKNLIPNVGVSTKIQRKSTADTR